MEVVSEMNVACLLLQGVLEPSEERLASVCDPHPACLAREIAGLLFLLEW